MNFFEINPRQDYAGYGGDAEAGEISEPRIIPPYRKIAGTVSEYLGDPPRKPGKKGDYHAGSLLHFVRNAALELMSEAARGNLIVKPVRVTGRDEETFHQAWVVNFVDCLDEANTVSSPQGGFYKDKIGVIKRPAFDESRWDGSDLFVVPQDPSTSLFCTERFIANWKQAKLKGALFSRFLMDPDAIKS
jgi:hypothetical protein